MTSERVNDKVIFCNLVKHSMLIRNSAGPKTSFVAFQASRFTDPVERGATALFHHSEDSFEPFGFVSGPLR